MRLVATSIVSILIAILLQGCAGTTPIKNVALPPVSIIEGSITQRDEGGFTLKDSSGSIYVSAALPDKRQLNISVNEKVKVYGNLRGGQEKIFDGYVVKKSTGEQIMIDNPTPHIGFIIQTAFK